MRTALLGCFLIICLLGQVWNKHLLVETESQEEGEEIKDAVESENMEEVTGGEVSGSDYGRGARGGTKRPRPTKRGDSIVHQVAGWLGDTLG